MASIPRISAHPILEPVNYDLSPENAAEILQDELLEIYSLLWRAGVATAMDGPAVCHETIEVHLRGIQTDSKEEPALVLRAFDIDCLDDGWGILLPSELDRVRIGDLGTNGPFPNIVTAAIAETGAAYLDGDGRRHRSIEQCASLLPLLTPPTTWSVATTQLTASGISVDRLVEMMEATGTGRPATYADRLTKTIENGLIVTADNHLEVGDYGQQVLDALSKLARENVIDAQYNSDLESALRLVEADPALAGQTLREFCRRALGVEPVLGDWLDDLAIEGESLNEALARAEAALPPARSWDSLVLPPGISPETLIRDMATVIALRDELDEILAAPDRQAWKRLPSRGRAACRLVAISANDTSLQPENLIVKASRDIALRWWIDLAPQEHPFSPPEMQTGKTFFLSLNADTRAVVMTLASRLAHSL